MKRIVIATDGSDAAEEAVETGLELAEEQGAQVSLVHVQPPVLAIGSYAKLPYHPREDFTFISGMWQLPNILTAKKGLFSADIKELLAAFRKEPGKYTYASAGFGTTLHLSGEMMNSMAGVQVRHVPYRGGAGGVLGADAVAKAAPDGYTVGLGGIAQNVLAIGSYAKLPYDPRGDFTFIGGMWQLPNILSARKDLFSSDLKQLLAAFK